VNEASQRLTRKTEPESPKYQKHNQNGPKHYISS
jgi:hypothetical protein